MLALVVTLLISTTSLHHATGNLIDVDDDYYDIYNSEVVMNETDTLEYNDTLLESLFDSPYFRSPNDKNWRYSFSEDMDVDKDGVLSDEEKRQKIHTGMELVFQLLDKNNDSFVSKEEISSPSLDLDAATELAMFSFDVAPYRYDLTYYDLMQMRWVDYNNDAFLSTEEIEVRLREWLEVITDDQKEIIREVFNFFDENNDNKLSMDDLKPKLKTLLSILFKIYDQNNDGLLSLEDINFQIQWEDITSILSILKDKYMPNGELNLNHFLVPFELDINGDGAMNNLDMYLSWSSSYDYRSFSPAAKILKLLDQDQDGVYKHDEIKNFVVTIWSLLDANHDMNLSLEDGYLLLKDKLNVDEEKISALKNFINYVKTFWKDEGTRLAEFIFQAIDRNVDEMITMQEFTQMPEMCFYGWRDDSCFNPRQFPEPPSALDGDQFFPQSKYFRIPRYRIWQSRLMALAFSVLDSPMFYNVKGNYRLSVGVSLLINL